MFESVPNLFLGLITGFVFGFLLQKGRVAKFEVITGQLLLRDWTVAKIMLTAIAVGGIGVYALVTMEMASLHIKPALLGGVIVGGLLFGCGMAILGYCPGTTVAACGEGHRDALFGLAGMLAGAFTYVWLYPAWNAVAGYWGDAGKVTLPQISETSPWPWVVALVAAVAAFRFLLRSSTHATIER
jgi:uncharacterized membrane protein YedE/YeeE